jgi:prepilin signal peptidase PulO-like enzyme (type II secretory pathway)
MMFDSPGTCLMLLGIGSLVSLLVNHFIYSLAYQSPRISSWQTRPDGTTALTLWERLPAIGWLLRSFRKDDQVVFGKWFWVRPFLIEILFPWLFLALYFFILGGNTQPRNLSGSSYLVNHFIAYAILITLLTIATFIDFDERTIPDWITIPGTIVGLLGSTFLVGWNWVEVVRIPTPPFEEARFFHANSPEIFPESWKQGNILGLIICLATWFVWCTSLIDFRWITRRGWKKAFEYAWVSYKRSVNRRSMTILTIVGWVLIGLGYFFLEPNSWMRLVSGLVGVWLGGLLVWAFRMVAGEVLGQEALGFGDVTLMSMVGAFFGWQIVWLAFFLAPLFGVLLVIIKALVTGDTRTPFGPYLSTATVFLMLKWPETWEICSLWMFSAINAPWVLLVLLLVLGGLLWIIHRLKIALGLGG